MMKTLIERTGGPPRPRLMAISLALAVVLACVGIVLALTARPSDAALRAFNGGAVTSGDGGIAQSGNTTAITIPAGGSATPYPSQINVSGVSGPITNVSVSLSNYSHSFPDDVDVLLVGPGGQKVMLMSDAGGSLDVINQTLTFSDQAANPLPDNAQITSGFYKPTDYQPGETMPGSAPAGPYGTSLAVFDGTSPNGLWQLYVSDDLSGDSGSIAGGWSLSISTAGSGTPYPSQVNVSGFSGPVTDLDLTLNGLSHTWPSDLDVMLVGPGGRKALVMSDVGGSTDAVGLNLTLNDEATNPMSGAALASGAYKPTNVNSPGDFPDVFPAPAPAVGGSALSAFDGVNPNGAWRLYVVDDARFDTGGITGWSLRVTANVAPNAVNDAFRVKEDKTLKRNVLANDTDPEGNSLTAVRVSRPKHGKLTLGANGSFTYKPKRNYNGRDSFVYEARDGKGGADRATVNIRVKSVRN